MPSNNKKAILKCAHFDNHAFKIRQQFLEYTTAYEIFCDFCDTLYFCLFVLTHLAIFVVLLCKWSNVMLFADLPNKMNECKQN